MHLSLSFLIYNKSLKVYIGFLVLILSMTTMLCGCAVERNVKDNRFYSSYPKMVIDVDKKFDYLGSGKFQTSGAMNMEHEYFVFSGKADKQVIQKGIIIEVAITLSKYYPQGVPYILMVDDKQKNIFAYGHKMINDNQYDYYVTCSSSMTWNKNWLGNWEGGNEIGKWLNEKGYMLPRCGLKQVIIELGIDSHKIITYVEDATLSGVECSKWYDKNQLTEKQKQYLDEFTVRADRALKLVPF